MSTALVLATPPRRGTPADPHVESPAQRCHPDRAENRLLSTVITFLLESVRVIGKSEGT